MNKNMILEIKNITKEFPGVKALEQVSFEIKSGDVHALIGENGAGKSTLIKLLAGIYIPDSGEIKLNGKAINFNNPNDARKAGISVVHQEIKLVDTLSVAENIFLGDLVYTKLGTVNWKAMREKAAKLIDSLGINIDPDQTVSELTIAKKQIIEICKAINTNSKVIIMDEPSATLTNKEMVILFDVIKNLKQNGYTIIYISHRLDEIFVLADMVTVLRDGKHITTLPIENVDKDQLIHLMVGRDLGNEYPKEVVEIGKPILEVKNLTITKELHDISFQVRKGEIFGISGLVGAGRTELARAVLGIDKIDEGEVIYKGKPISNHSFADAINSGIGLVPEDRKTQGLVQFFPVKENICMVAVDKIIKKGLIRESLQNSFAQKYVKLLNISTPDVGTQVQYLSGGNQQKIVIAKWIMMDSELIFLDEPTRGVDVGAKVEIYKLISDLVRRGKTVVMISSELPELLSLCDRIMVMHEGRVKGEFFREEASQEKILALCV